jgi:hypothetical protein
VSDEPENAAPADLSAQFVTTSAASAAAPVAAACAMVALGVLLFASTGHDDSHITYWAARMLRETGQILNYNGERVEQGSSLLHVVLLGLLGLVTGVQMPTLGPLTSIGGGVLSFFVTRRLAASIEPAATPLAVILLATSACFVYWSFGGLETTLAAASFAWLVVTWGRHLEKPSRASIVTAALATTAALSVRPESPMALGLVAAAIVAFAALRPAPSRPALRPAVELASLVAVGSIALFAFRKLYFGSYLPNPAYSKGETKAVAEGLEYVLSVVFPQHLALFLAAGAGAVLVLRRAARLRTLATDAVAALFTLAYLGFIVLVGGDWMWGGRFLAHIAPLLAALAALAVSSVLRGRAAHRVAFAMATLGVFGAVHLALTSSTGRVIGSDRGVEERLARRIGDRGFGWFEIKNTIHLRDVVAAAALDDMVRAIREKAPERELVIMSPQAGLVTYHVFGNHRRGLRFVDMYSLSTRGFVRCAPEDLIEKTKHGALLGLRAYFANQAVIDARCGTRRPDIIFGLNRHRFTQLKQHGYVFAYDQTGHIIDPSGLTGRFRTVESSRQIIAVDGALAELAGIPAKEPWEWDI